jgi:hypothetical protein
MQQRSRRVNDDLLIDTRQDRELTGGVVISSGGEAYTTAFDLRRDGNAGSLGLYIDCSGPGTFNLTYETDPGKENDSSLLEPDNWFEPDYDNPLRTSYAAGRVATPICAVVGQWIRFKIEAVGGDVTINDIKLVIQ